MENGSLMKIESIAECLEHSAILLTCIKLYSALKTNFGLHFEWPLNTSLCQHRRALVPVSLGYLDVFKSILSFLF